MGKGKPGLQGPSANSILMQLTRAGVPWTRTNEGVERRRETVMYREGGMRWWGVNKGISDPTQF